MLENISVQAIRRNWWMLALRGVLAIIFGLIALFAPGIALLAFIFVFAAYALIDGLMAVYIAIRERGSLSRWGWVLFEGILGIIAGIVAFVHPGFTALVLLYVVAIWAVITGIMELVTAFAIRRFAAREWALGLAGVVSILFGIVLFIFPGAGLLSILWLVGIYGIVFGILFIVRAFQLRVVGSIGHTIDQHKQNEQTHHITRESRDTMRIVSWNCNMGFEKKRDVVMSLQPDILVLQECSAKDIANTDAPFKHWIGSNMQKGMAIIGFASYDYAVDASYTQEWPWFLPLRVENVPLHILGLWACVKDRRLRYVRVAHQAIDHYARFLSAPNVIAIGDFNSNTIWDGRYSEYSHTELVAKLGRSGLVSAYHTLRGELHGKETTPTWYMYRHLAHPYHLDYAFVSQALSISCDLAVGEPGEWLRTSDHMPLVLTLAI